MNILNFQIKPLLKKGFVYFAKNINNQKIYIGMTTTSLNRRKTSHKHSSKLNQNSYFHLAIKKHGFNNFKWGVLFESFNLEELKEKEVFFIKLFKSNDRTIGYNLSTGGEHPMFNESVRELISKKAKDRLKTKEKNPFYGKKHSKETRIHFSNIRKGKKPNNMFVKHNELTKKILSEKRKKLCKDPEFLKKMALCNQKRIRIKCIETEKIYETIKEAAIDNNINYSTFKNYINKQKSINNLTFLKI